MTSSDLTAQPPVVAPGAALRPGLLRSRVGEVVAFDVDAGLGQVVSFEGETYPFHCTAIAGGARVIEVGAKVVFSLLAFHGGELQASDLVEYSRRGPARARSSH
jgi:hypothetical protein